MGNRGSSVTQRCDTGKSLVRLRFVAARACGVNLEVSSSSSAPLRRFGLGRYLVGGGIPRLEEGQDAFPLEAPEEILQRNLRQI